MDHSETSTNSSGPEPQMGQVKSSGSSSHSMVKTQLLQANFFMATAPLRLTFIAKSGEGQLAAVYMTAGGAFYIGTQRGGDGDLGHVQHTVAAGANKVDVGVGVGIEAFCTVDCADADDLTLFLEERQIPVDCCLRNVGMLLLQHLVNHLC